MERVCIRACWFINTVVFFFNAVSHFREMFAAGRLDLGAARCLFQDLWEMDINVFRVIGSVLKAPRSAATLTGKASNSACGRVSAHQRLRENAN